MTLLPLLRPACYVLLDAKSPSSPSDQPYGFVCFFLLFVDNIFEYLFMRTLSLRKTAHRKGILFTKTNICTYLIVERKQNCK